MIHQAGIDKISMYAFGPSSKDSPTAMVYTKPLRVTLQLQRHKVSLIYICECWTANEQTRISPKETNEKKGKDEKRPMRTQTGRRFLSRVNPNGATDGFPGISKPVLIHILIARLSLNRPRYLMRMARYPDLLRREF